MNLKDLVVTERRSDPSKLKTILRLVFPSVTSILTTDGVISSVQLLSKNDCFRHGLQVDFRLDTEFVAFVNISSFEYFICYEELMHIAECLALYPKIESPLTLRCIPSRFLNDYSHYRLFKAIAKTSKKFSTDDVETIYSSFKEYEKYRFPVVLSEDTRYLKLSNALPPFVASIETLL